MHVLSGSTKNYELAFRSTMFKDMDPKRHNCFFISGGIEYRLSQYIRDNGNYKANHRLLLNGAGISHEICNFKIRCLYNHPCSCEIAFKLIEVSHWLSNTCYFHCLE